MLFTAERGRQRYLLSMLLRYPRQIAGYADRLSTLRPDDAGLAAAWDHVLGRPAALALEDFTAGLPDDGPLTAAYLTALLRETAQLPPLDETRLRVALDDALTLLQGEQLRQKIARCQARLREASDEERPAIVAELAALARERAAMDYNRERPA